MKGTRAAQRYAKAILALANDQKVSSVVNSDMESISKTIAGSDELQGVLASPVIKNELKKNSLSAIFKDAHATTLGTFDLLLENNRIDILKYVAQQYTILYNEENNIQVATVTTAVPLNTDLEAKIQHKIQELTGNSAIITNVVDPAIIGGFILRIGDLQYNASVARSFNDLRRELISDTYFSTLN